MNESHAGGFKGTAWMAVAGAAVTAVGMLGGFPVVIAAGLLACWGGAFMTLIAFLETQG